MPIFRRVLPATPRARDNSVPVPPSAPLESPPRFWKRRLAEAADAGTFALLNAVQARRWRDTSTPADIERYLAVNGALSLEEYYAAPPPEIAELVLPPTDASPRLDAAGLPVPYPFNWPSPHPGAYPVNNTAHVDFYPARIGWPEAPTVFFLHALMSASDLGYRMWAKTFHARGWNACFVQLPYHYRRRPPGFFNGELAIGSDVLRTAEGLRQGVKELRQLRGACQRAGAREFGVWATSYGGWTGALWSAVEAGFRFVALIQPIVDVDDVIWRSPAGATIRRQLRARGVTRDLPSLRALYRLGNPSSHPPLDDARRVLLAAGDYDRAVSPASLYALHQRWAGSRYLHGPQGHFGYLLMRETFRRLEASRLL